MTSEKSGFWAELGKRRIPQVLGFYLAGSYTLFEFSQWIIGRFALSPYWQDILLLTLLLALPAVLMLAWHHGAPGRQPWSLTEKVLLPVNALLIPLVIFMLYSDKELGSTTEMIKVVDDDGTVMERELAKSEFLTSVVIFPFTDKTGDPELDFLGVITPDVLSRDMGQNIYFVAMDPFFMAADIERAGLTIDRLPLAMQLNLAKKFSREYIVNGSIERETDQFVVTADIFKVGSGRKTNSISVKNADYFDAIDEVTRFLTKQLTVNAEYLDLPVGDLYTDNWEAFREYSIARTLQMFSDRPADAEAHFKKALELDETFAYAAFWTSLYNIQQQRLNEALTYARQALKHRDYRLFEREKFSINATELFLDRKIDRAQKVIDQWIQLYPRDWSAYFLRANFSLPMRDFSSAIANFKKVIEIDPSQHHLWDQVGDLYTVIGDYENALNAYENYAAANPGKSLAHKNMGDLYRKMAKPDSAISAYQKALAVEPNNIATLRNLAQTYSRLGNIDEAEDTYLQAIEMSRALRDELSARNSLSNHYWNYGKWQKFLESKQETYALAQGKVPEVTLGIQSSGDAWRYYLAGEEARAEKLISDAYASIGGSTEDIAALNIRINEAVLLNHQGQAKQALGFYDNIFEVAREYLQNQNDPEIFYMKGQSYYFTGEYQEAIESFQAALERYPDELSFMEWPARAYLAEGQLESAEKLYSKMLSIAPGYPEYNLGMSEVKFQQQDLPSALEYVEKALEGWSAADMEFADLTKARELLATINSGLSQ